METDERPGATVGAIGLDHRLGVRHPLGPERLDEQAPVVAEHLGFDNEHAPDDR
jgi:hypothetical protein